MYYIVSDFYSTYKDRMKMVCGKGGLSRRISSVGILDYEFLPEVRGKFKHYNFDPEQLVVSTLMYARDDQRLISDAIRDLINAGVSGLVIKDIFKVKIPDTMLRYAEARNFPIFIFDSKEPFVEDIIFDVKSAILRQESADRTEMELDFITSDTTGEQEVYDHARLLCPSFETQHKVYYMLLGDDFGRNSFADQFRRFESTELFIPECLFAPYERGLLYITSWEHNSRLGDEEVLDLLIQISGSMYHPIGISDTHYYLGELGRSIKEAMYASLTADESSEKYIRFDDLGLLKIVFPLSDDPVMTEFSEKILEPIRDFDLENNGKLLETLAAWSEHGMSFPEAASVLHQHENTLRYRMDKISQITGLDFKKAADSQQLNMAYLIDYCKGLTGLL